MTLIDSALLDGLERHRSRNFNRYFARGTRRVFGLAKLLPDSDDEIERPVIEGRLIEFGRAINHNGQLITFMADAFDDAVASGNNVKYCADHDSKAVLADTQSGAVEIVKRDDGLYFRCDVRKSFNPLALLGIVSSKNRRSISIGFTEQASEKHLCGGREVKFITKADLVEFSAVKKGCSASAFAYVTCAKKYQAPSANYLSEDFERNSSAFLADTCKVVVASNGYDWASLAARVTAIENKVLSRRLDVIEAELSRRNLT